MLTRFWSRPFIGLIFQPSEAKRCIFSKLKSNHPIAFFDHYKSNKNIHSSEQMWQLKHLEKSLNSDNLAQLGQKFTNTTPLWHHYHSFSRALSALGLGRGEERGEERRGEEPERQLDLGRRRKKKPPWPHFHLWSWSSVWREFSEELAVEQREALCLLTTMFLIQNPISFLGRVERMAWKACSLLSPVIALGCE